MDLFLVGAYAQYLKLLSDFIGNIVQVVVADFYACTSLKRLYGGFIRHLGCQPGF